MSKQRLYQQNNFFIFVLSSKIVTYLLSDKYKNNIFFKSSLISLKIHNLFFNKYRVSKI